MKNQAKTFKDSTSGWNRHNRKGTGDARRTNKKVRAAGRKASKEG